MAGGAVGHVHVLLEEHHERDSVIRLCFKGRAGKFAMFTLSQQTRVDNHIKYAYGMPGMMRLCCG